MPDRMLSFRASSELNSTIMKSAIKDKEKEEDDAHGQNDQEANIILFTEDMMDEKGHGYNYKSIYIQTLLETNDHKQWAPVFSSYQLEEFIS